MNDVDGDDGGDGVGRVFAGGKQARAEDDSHFAVEVVFECRGQCEGLARAGVEQNGRVGIGAVISSYRSVVLVAIGGIEREDPAAGNAIFPGRVDEQGGARVGAAAESLGSAVDADVFDVD